MRKPTDIFIHRFPFRGKRFKIVSLLLLLIVCGVVGDVVFFSFAPYSLLYPAKSTGEMVTADVAAILFNDFEENSTGINNETKRRVNHGIALLQRAKVRHLIMAGGNRPGVEKSGSTLMAEYALKQGVVDGVVLVDNKSHDSLGNMANIRAIMAANNWQRLVLVSSPSHLARMERIGLVTPGNNIVLSPYNPLSGKPAITRFEFWRSVHKNLIAELLWRMIPQGYYRDFVAWVRANTGL